MSGPRDDGPLMRLLRFHWGCYATPLRPACLMAGLGTAAAVILLGLLAS